MYELLNDPNLPKNLDSAFTNLVTGQKNVNALSELQQQVVYLQNSHIEKEQHLKEKITTSVCEFLLTRSLEIPASKIVYTVGDLLKRGMDNPSPILSAKELNDSLNLLCVYALLHSHDNDPDMKLKFIAAADSLIERFDIKRVDDKIPAEQLSDQIKPLIAAQRMKTKSRYSKDDNAIDNVFDTTMYLFQETGALDFEHDAGCAEALALTMGNLNKNMLSLSEKQQMDLIEFATTYHLDMTIPKTHSDRNQRYLASVSGKLCDKGPDKDWRNQFSPRTI